MSVALVAVLVAAFGFLFYHKYNLKQQALAQPSAEQLQAEEQAVAELAGQQQRSFQEFRPQTAHEAQASDQSGAAAPGVAADNFEATSFPTIAERDSAAEPSVDSNPPQFDLTEPEGPAFEAPTAVEEDPFAALAGLGTDPPDTAAGRGDADVDVDVDVDVAATGAGSADDDEPLPFPTTLARTDEAAQPAANKAGQNVGSSFPTFSESDTPSAASATIADSTPTVAVSDAAADFPSFDPQPEPAKTSDDTFPVFPATNSRDVTAAEADTSSPNANDEWVAAESEPNAAAQADAPAASNNREETSPNDVPALADFDSPVEQPSSSDPTTDAFAPSTNPQPAATDAASLTAQQHGFDNGTPPSNLTSSDLSVPSPKSTPSTFEPVATSVEAEPNAADQRSSATDRLAPFPTLTTESSSAVVVETTPTPVATRPMKPTNDILFPTPLPEEQPVQPAIGVAKFVDSEPVQQVAGVADECEILTVRADDNYWKISRRAYGTARYFSSLALYNQHRIPDPRKLRPGMKVLIPAPEVLQKRYPEFFEDTQKKRNLPTGFFVQADGTPAYRVGERETLSEISQQHLGRASRWIQIYRLNQQSLADPNRLKPGTVLLLPEDATNVQVRP